MVDWTYIPSDSCTGGVAPELAYSALGRACVWRSVGGFLGLDRRASSRGVALSSPGPRGGSAGFSTLIRHTTLSVPTQPPRSYRQMPGLRYVFFFLIVRKARSPVQFSITDTSTAHGGALRGEAGFWAGPRLWRARILPKGARLGWVRYFQGPPLALAQPSPAQPRPAKDPPAQLVLCKYSIF